MSGFWILLMTFIAMYTVQLFRCWVSAQSLSESLVYQPEKEISVNISDSATLQCCISKTDFGTIALLKLTKRTKPQVIVYFYTRAGETFYNESQKLRFKIERFSSCINMTILSIIKSDEGMYYCMINYPYTVFGDGTDLKIKGQSVTSVLEQSQPALHGNSVVYEATLHENNTKMNTKEKAVNGSTENCPETRQDSEPETLNYAALQFSRMQAQAEKRKTGSLNECVYSDVK
ncbi:uncharacterized protein Hap1MRO34_012114 isoform 2-T2 [Clarias gariepinus]|uniref:uncharacterized protein LOC128532304 isoform X2 n=1 Tax=Clarias gariepinus TaxID=13013 RepID=UPI00234DA9EE|nr:uncharacterized protein LOC128532304 isoform X2 [Clarias gariepinus]